MTVLAIGAHFDDIEIGCGGTLATRRFPGLHLAVLRPDDYLGGDPAVRAKEQDDALRLMFEPTLHLLRAPSIEAAVSALEVYSPRLIFAPWPHDTHQDHRFVGEIGLSLSRRKDRVVAFYDAATSQDFRPNAFQRITWEVKFKLISSHASQTRRLPWLLSYLDARERAHGLRTFGGGHAEAFHVGCFDLEALYVG